MATNQPLQNFPPSSSAGSTLTTAGTGFYNTSDYITYIDSDNPGPLSPGDVYIDTRGITYTTTDGTTLRPLVDPVEESKLDNGYLKLLTVVR